MSELFKELSRQRIADKVDAVERRARLSAIQSGVYASPRRYHQRYPYSPPGLNKRQTQEKTSNKITGIPKQETDDRIRSWLSGAGKEKDREVAMADYEVLPEESDLAVDPFLSDEDESDLFSSSSNETDTSPQRLSAGDLIGYEHSKPKSDSKTGRNNSV